MRVVETHPDPGYAHQDNRWRVRREVSWEPQSSGDAKHLCKVCEPSLSPLESRFQQLVKQWRTETMLTSSMTRIIFNAAYQQIIGMGPSALRLIFRELRAEPDHWDWALRSITHANPVPKEAVGDLRATAGAWLRWGEKQGYV